MIIIVNWNFQMGWEWGGEGVNAKKPSMGGVWIFSGTTQFIVLHDCVLCHLHVEAFSLITVSF